MTPGAMAAIHKAAMTTARPWSDTEIAGLLADRTVFAVTESDGFALGRTAAGEAELLTLAVAPGAQRAGIGFRLLAKFEQRAQARGADTAFLEVAEDNSAARALYAKAGWQETGRRPRYYARDGVPAAAALILAKSLV